MPYDHHTCPHCGQSLTYELDIDKGSVETLKTISAFIKRKGRNAVHLTKELQGNGLTSHQIGNISRLRFQGLVAKIEGEAGNYCLTRKGLDFLKGLSVPRTAIIKKGTENTPPHLLGYGDEMCQIKDFDKAWDGYWNASGYDIKEGRVIPPFPAKPVYPEEHIQI
jgi:predicted transcriptional regulator